MFANLVHEYGARDEEKLKPETSKQALGQTMAKEGGNEKDQDVKEQGALMQDEERITGAVDLQTYVKYARYGGR
jgi:ATP-binding cassette subfamily C (CFTR/MRP) protein 1